MRAYLNFLAVLMALLLAMPPAWADQATAEDDSRTLFTCPIGGEQFRQFVDMFYYPLEGLPNGSSPGGQLSDIMVPICPGNGLVMAPKYDGEEGDPEAFAEYTSEEIARLPALISSPEYKALADEANYLKLYWLSGQLGRPAVQRFHLLQHVSWIGKTPEQRRQYLELFVRDADALIDDLGYDPAKRNRSRYFVVNALRELGRFDEAKTRLNALQQAWDVELAAMLAQREQENPNFESDRDYDSNDAFTSAMAEQLAAIEARDDDTFPVSMMGDKWANAVCRNIDDDYPPATELTKRNCIKLAEAEKAASAKSQSDFDATEALLDNPSKLAALCKSTPESAREEILNDACYRAEYQANQQRMEAGSAQLLKNPKALDAQCKGMKFGQYSRPKTALGMACQKRREATNAAEQTALAAKLRKQPAEYDRLCTMEYPESYSDDPLEAACGTVKDERDNVRDDAMRARLDKMSEAEIWAECEKTNGGDDVEGYTLSFRCSDIESDREEAQWKALEADPAKLAATCAKPYGEQEEWRRSRCSFYNEGLEDQAAMELAKDRPKLLATCAATPVPERDQILQKACSGYRKCVVMRYDEMPYSAVQSFGAYEQTDPAELTSACYDTAAKADAAYARYVADPRSLRASCKPETEFAEEPYEPELCARYASGVDVFAEMRAQSAGVAAAEISTVELGCRDEADEKHKSESAVWTNAVALCVTNAPEKIEAPQKPFSK